MARAPRLDDAAVTAALAELAGWTGDAGSIEKTVEAPSFLAGIELVRHVATTAEDLDHHPDIDIRWRTIRFLLTTHTVPDGGPPGLTGLDVELAHRIDGHVLAQF
jgi:4a-hydroxytetrahydrobiopterin dehydratase